jgi:hypothetical protein
MLLYVSSFCNIKSSHNPLQNELTYSHVAKLFITNVNQHSSSVTLQSMAMDPLRTVSKETETCKGEF